MKWKRLLLLCASVFLVKGLWFSASAATPALIREWSLTAGASAWLTMAVQAGFVAGALASAVANAADRWAPRRLLALGALSGAAFNALIPALNAGWPATLALRFLTGASLALVYPVGMKIMATWTVRRRGTGLGLMIGALTLGSASPHLISGLGGIEAWRPVFYGSSALAAIGGLLGLRYGELGPHGASVPPFHWRYLAVSFRERALRLANLGYLGHMWELYAMWTWIPLFLATSFQAAGLEASQAGAWASFSAFAVIGIGGLGSVVAGRLADGWGRTRTTILSMAVSGSCAMVIGFLIGSKPWLVLLVALLWGFAVVADSAQFSTSVSELGAKEYMGTLLTTQTCLGFLLTLLTIRLVPMLVEWSGWTLAFPILALGPLLGCLSMGMLRKSPEAVRLAGGRR